MLDTLSAVRILPDFPKIRDIRIISVRLPLRMRENWQQDVEAPSAYGYPVCTA